jgi:hypothetical protein
VFGYTGSNETIAAKERKEHKEINVLCDLSVLSRRINSYKSTK